MSKKSRSRDPEIRMPDDDPAPQKAEPPEPPPSPDAVVAAAMPEEAPAPAEGDPAPGAGPRKRGRPKGSKTKNRAAMPASTDVVAFYRGMLHQGFGMIGQGLAEPEIWTLRGPPDFPIDEADMIAAPLAQLLPMEEVDPRIALAVAIVSIVGGRGYATYVVKKEKADALKKRRNLELVTAPPAAMSPSFRAVANPATPGDAPGEVKFADTPAIDPATAKPLSEELGVTIKGGRG